MYNIRIILCINFCVLQVSSLKWHISTSEPKDEDYRSERELFLKEEHRNSIGGDLKLNEKELKANRILMQYKLEELDEGFLHPTKFAPARSFLESVNDVKKSKVFQYLKLLPKGAVLHGHDTALVSVDYIVKNLTYRENLYAKLDEHKNLDRLYFFEKPPSDEWKSIHDMRLVEGADIVDTWLTDQLTLGKQDVGLDVNTVWKRFLRIFSVIKPMLKYEHVWLDHFYQTLKEFHEDNVSYLEFRGNIPSLYRLDGSFLNETEVCRLYIDTLSNFKQDHPNFVGSKLIYAISRSVDEDGFEEYMKKVKLLKKQFPDFIAGFDLVGQEDTGNSLLNFSDGLLKMQNELNFYFHAGETNWSGFLTDENLVDAILLGTKRIGHGYALLKHPKVAKIVREKNIGVEICPISNQVLGLVQDMRNHPGAYLLTHNYPVVIAPDDPGFWGAKGASYDWYQAFMGLAAKWQDLRLLKQLAINSIDQSSLDVKQKQRLIEQWEGQWDYFIEYLNKDHSEGIIENNTNHIY